MVGVPANQLSKLQRLQNAAAHLVSNVAEYDHVTPTLVNLHWLPVTYRVNFKMAMLAHKCIYGNAPEYLKVARYSFSGPIPPKFEHKLRRHKQSFGKIATTVVLDKDENLL